MFTGLVEEVGTIVSLVERGGNHRSTIQAPQSAKGLKEGNSIAVSGVCLTALDIKPDTFCADLAKETWTRTSFSRITEGALVNLELPLKVDARMGGHIVQGHVDGTGEFLSLEALGDDNWWLRIRVPAELDPYLVFKGSIAIDGISLTIASLESDVLAVTIIPHTFRGTTLGGYRPGARVNLECDVLAKHVEKLLKKLDLKEGLTIDKLRAQGY